jgi:hypothetical protein
MKYALEGGHTMVMSGRRLLDLHQVLRQLSRIVFLCAVASVTEAWAQTPVLTPVPTPAQAPAPTASGNVVECGGGSGRQVCEANTVSGVVLVHQVGEGTCVLGRTWGYDAKSVWVSDGCHGRFATADTRQTLTCASETGTRQVCEGVTTDGVAVVSASPGCVLGKTWGYDDRGVWVDGGCRATFALTTRGSLTCVSANNGRQHCAADTSAGVVLARSTGSVGCVLGDTWGYDAKSVWVDRGCNAEFVLGQTAAGGPENQDLNDFFGLFEPYGRLRGHLAFFNDEAEIQDAASWLGLRFSTRGPVKFFAATEWGVNLVNGGQNLVAGATTSSGFFTVETTETQEVFGPRLGYAGVDFGYGGRVAIGKQWSVHFDITGYTTDRFNVFGSQASATYTASSDGGFLGNGRANQALSYRNKLWIFDIGAQAQFRTVDNDEIFDSAGLSAQVTVLPGVRIGGTYSKAFFGEDQIGEFRGLDDDAEYGAVGGRVDFRFLEAALVYAKQRNADVANVEVTGPAGAPPSLESIVFDADGYEFFARVRFPGFAVLAVSTSTVRTSWIRSSIRTSARATALWASRPASGRAHMPM